MSELADLAQLYGVATEFVDWRGRNVPVSEDTLVGVLAALGVPAGTEAERIVARRAHERDYWAHVLPPTIVARSGTASSFWVHVTHGDPVELWIRLEDGTVHSGLRQLENNRPPYDLDGRPVGEASFELPAGLPAGYHRLHAQSGGVDSSTVLIVAPATLPAPPGRHWGLATQLYSVTSENSWGTGDITDLTDLAVWSATRHGAGFILVNPLHAAAPVAPMEPSPYLPTSRRFVNPLYLRVEAVPEYAFLRKRGPLRKARADLAARALRSDGIDRDAAWKVKRAALAQLYRVPRSAGRELAYAGYREREGRSLDDFATWCALAEVHGPDWHRWPAELGHPDSPAVAAFAAAHPQAVDFHRWLQWLLDDQLTAAQATAVQSGMSLGIMHDLAVGVDPDGADAWALQDVLALGVSAGAPPDEYNQLGQDWSQPPWRPDQLEKVGYAPFRALVNAVLRHAGGVRIDHIIGLFRLWWIPEGAPPTEGTYVRYDHDALIGIVALEAMRAGAVVVGEDLGTVEPWVRDYLAARGLFGTSILWFERDREWGREDKPLPADRWREACLSSVTTHDLPPTAGYLAGEHIRIREELGLLTRPAEDELAHDRAEQAAWRDELRRLGLVGEAPDTDEIIRGLYAYLGRTPSKLLALALPDAVGDVRAQNQPGTTDEYPNWRVPLTGPDGRRLQLEDIFADPRAYALAEVMKTQVRTMES
ncbi:4-alpha-glucanotransferase [Mycolicibacterium diernhoferi]|uniref:4-alpha-glucanotransferase n=1 Tax=Mycolicibacterium diernhoferi TaxID=1801 RepID=A0A1Q4H8Y4_9MYCO|nr:4-alpha-glucanotransferase [Mycolicibacterium diernhoferi]OJZ63977.1 4-alpha-glucanotransferase [Mycolicibacterium diernhoferi]OPE54132.1 4-alpha-glucanotransferase [Mycolicibacterium diernhoferi]PEG55639.1 4-alpha-glucanotransferase [Mycolicibacterium diernhoferi]QYL20665.1 4-alpha-glucanotransferase [Mycolicibacterium diernhoferi]